jgi:hypothetical protein
VREWGIEQHVRDARVTMIYEGTNEIQAIDLLLRKVIADGASAFNLWLDDLRADLDSAQPAHTRLLARLASLQDHARGQVLAAARDDTLAYWNAQDFLRAVALVLLDWAWTLIARTGQAGMPRWRAPALALERWIMPELQMRLGIIKAGTDGPPVAVSDTEPGP